MVNGIKPMFVQPNKSSTYSVLGDLYTLLAEGKDTSGAYGLVEVVMQPQSIIPSHTHEQVEAHYIIAGEIEYQLDSQTVVATKGAFLHIGACQVHSFKNIGSEPAKLLMWVTPGGPEQFFAEAGQPVKLPISEEEKRRLSQPPSPADIEKAVELASTKYGLTFPLVK
ncbi:cupin 2 domain-containing protein [Calothrix sp. NIES-4071]|nr:cupin 2 domain-containing protein [Calothrix sp. NIES-4071]BAZ58620.1 cupin 2 domain-containing protein [Calothrix sp. NIES-4105]